MKEICRQYLIEPSEFVSSFELERNGKKREIVTYQGNKYGYAFRRVHRKLLDCMYSIPSSHLSHAYQPGKCTKDALECHLNSNLFMKIDIHNFFESITEERFFNCATDMLNDFSEDDIRAFFYHGHLSLGFITSPKISDIYMYDFDCRIEEYLENFEDLRFSRYCDDILISTTNDNFGSLHRFYSFIEKELEKKALTINSRKTREFDLSKDTAVSFLGLNLTGKAGERRITISKRYILKCLALLGKTYKMMDEIALLNKRPITDETKEILDDLNRKCDFLKRVARSRIGYLKFNSISSYERFLKKHRNKFSFEWGNKWQ